FTIKGKWRPRKPEPPPNTILFLCLKTYFEYLFGLFGFPGVAQLVSVTYHSFAVPVFLATVSSLQIVLVLVALALATASFGPHALPSGDFHAPASKRNSAVSAN
ncbi:hypothetical protein, partial [Treponema sp. R80B11-R83G3]